MGIGTDSHQESLGCEQCGGAHAHRCILGLFPGWLICKEGPCEQTMVDVENVNPSERKYAPPVSEVVVEFRAWVDIK